MSNERFRFEPLGRGHNRQDFSCGVDALDRYFHQQAGQDQRRGLAAPHVLVDTANGKVAGYYTLSSTSVKPSSIPPEFSSRVGRYEAVPAILLGRLAVDQNYQGLKLGKFLLLDALRRCYEISRHDVAAWAVFVDAIDETARAFYEHHGFIRCDDDEYRLFLPMSTITRLGF